MLTPTQKALEEFDNQHDFERMCADILNALGYKDVTLIAPRGGSDGGVDITFTTENGGKGIACITLRQDSEKKFNEDFDKRKPGEFEKYYFFTNQYLTSKQKVRFAKFCIEKLDAECITQDREALRSILDSSLVTIRRKYLGIQDDNSDAIKKKITKILKYPATLSSTNFQDRIGIAELILTTPTNREIYYYIDEIDDEELKQIPYIGSTLHAYKENYYNLCLALNILTQHCKKFIGTQTITPFQFISGWTIYFKYFLLRSFGVTEGEANTRINTNYDISYEECEKVSNMLKNDLEVLKELDTVTSQIKAINDLIEVLIKDINTQNIS